uniref:Uncharacterized protein n=1 Tax=Lepeophtheirus salmonis TaxID=72036 RepID=A0A0K2TWL2_LEPSM
MDFHSFDIYISIIKLYRYTTFIQHGPYFINFSNLSTTGKGEKLGFRKSVS